MAAGADSSREHVPDPHRGHRCWPAAPLCGAAGLRPVIIALGAALVLSAPVTLISPDRICSFLIKSPPIVLQLSQLIVFAAYPRFALRGLTRGRPAVPSPAGTTTHKEKDR